MNTRSSDQLPKTPRITRPGQLSAEHRSSERVPGSARPCAPQTAVVQAIADIAVGRPVVVIDDEHRENEGDLIFAAEKATPQLLAFTIRYTSGYLCVPLVSADCDRLELPPMCPVNEDPKRTGYTVTVDARSGVTTGISASDRAFTARLLADPASRPTDFIRPGHILPLRALDGGVLRRPGHTEAAVDLTRMAGLRPAGVIAEIVSERDIGGMARGAELQDFCATHHLTLVTIADLIAYRRRVETHQLVRTAEACLPTADGMQPALGFVAGSGTGGSGRPPTGRWT
jgi:3,4-dihydroxy 2-butanone 4-phosphate synthase / GTP cyclohydrolase II